MILVFLASKRNRWREIMDFKFFAIKITEMDLTGKRAVLSEAYTQRSDLNSMINPLVSNLRAGTLPARKF